MFGFAFEVVLLMEENIFHFKKRSFFNIVFFSKRVFHIGEI